MCKIANGCTAERHWIVSHIARGSDVFYPYALTLRNLYDGGREVHWSVPNLDNPEYDTSGATVEPGMPAGVQVSA